MDLRATLKAGGGVKFTDGDPNSRIGVDTPAFWVAVIVVLAVAWVAGVHIGFKGAVSH